LSSSKTKKNQELGEVMVENESDMDSRKGSDFSTVKSIKAEHIILELDETERAEKGSIA
jgi:hypothetical protein